MGKLTDDITKLVGEIGTLRKGRVELMKDLVRGTKDLEDTVSAMRAGFQRNHAGMARRLKTNLKAFNRGLKSKVDKMEAGFRKNHSEMAKSTKAERLSFISGMSETVARMRKEFTSDLSGARRAWRGQN